MHEFGWLSVLPPVLTILLAILTRQVYISLLFGIWLGWTVLSSWNPLAGMAKSVDTIVGVFADAGNTRAILFTLLMGAVIAFAQYSGGMQGFVDWIGKKGFVKDRRSASMLAWFLGVVIFIESNICILVSGTVCRPIFDKMRVSREKLAYILDSTSAPKCMLIPLNAWGAYVIGLINAQNVERPVEVLVSAIPYNFYAVLAVSIVVFVVFARWDFGPMRTAESRVLETGAVLKAGATPMVSQEDAIAPKPGVPCRARNMVVPIVAMVLMVPAGLLITGDGDLMAGSGSTAVIWGVLTGLAVAIVSYSIQGIMKLKEMTSLVIRGMGTLLPVASLLVLAFSIGETCDALKTGIFVAQVAESAIPGALIPAVLFVLTCFIAFSTGTSWGTFAIMIPIAVPIVNLLGLDMGLTIAAVLGGGVFGDHCSPISDTSVISSMAAATDHIEHVRTQLPYASVAAAIAVGLYLVAGYLLGGS